MSKAQQSHVRRAIQVAYNKTVRKTLPRKYGIYAGVPVRRPKLLDFEDRNPTFKQGLITAIHDYINPGDTVTLVGGGRGVSTVHCVRAGGAVVAYEPAEEMCSMWRETVDVAGCTEDAELKQAIVGEGIDIFGTAESASQIGPSELETSDALVLDCEGAERSILENLTDWPETVICETHPAHGAPNHLSMSLLDAQGYEIESRKYEPDDNSGKVVLIGTNE